MDDAQAYKVFPHHRNWFNKLWLSEKLEYCCGPSGISPEKTGWYVVRPIMNISGMSIGAKKEHIFSGDVSKVPPGYFWCEWFEGNQYSVTFINLNGNWIQDSCWKGEKKTENLYKFTRWIRYDHQIFKLPNIFNDLKDLKLINVEFIDENPIEVHLRKSPDPNANELIPIWQDEKELVDKYEKMGYSYIQSYDSGDGFLEKPRVGFMIK